MNFKLKWKNLCKVSAIFSPYFSGVQEATDVKCILQLASDQTKIGAGGNKVTASLGLQTRSVRPLPEIIKINSVPNTYFVIKQAAF